MKRARIRRYVAIACVLLGAAEVHASTASGTLTTVGSDTASTLVTRWADAFTAGNANAHIQVQAAGSASAPAALTSGAADLGSMSRPMSASETDDFVRRFGYPPSRIVIAHDAVAVFVHPDNPLSRITLAQLDAVYSRERACAGTAPIRYWRDLGIEPGSDLGGSTLLVTGRNGASGTFELFREIALCGGDYRADVIAWPGNGAVVATVGGNREAIGYAGAGYLNGLVKPLALARDAGDAGVLPDSANVTQGRYPLARALYFYFNRPPGRATAALPAAFMAYAVSDEGQQLVRQEGFLPLAADERAEQRERLR